MDGKRIDYRNEIRKLIVKDKKEKVEQEWCYLKNSNFKVMDKVLGVTRKDKQK